MNKSRTPIMAALFVCAAAPPALGFLPSDRWSSTATDGPTGGNGDPVTVTWGIVPDGTNISGETDDSNLIDFLDGIYNHNGGGPITARPWFTYFQQSFDRWEELGGIDFVYESSDDGAQHGNGSPGVLGVRPDVRIGGVPIDGNSGTLAYNSFPNGGDMVIDTDDSYFNGTSNNSLRLRNTVMHEVGHGFGLGHTNSSDARFLLEPFISTAFEGPQYDDIRGIQHLYGDPFEKANNGQGNQTSSLATDLGAIADGQTFSLGTDTGFATAVAATATDFVSIANNGDTDFYSFQIDEPSLIDLTLTPVGATFDQNGTTFVTSEISNLSLALIDTNGFSILSNANTSPVGVAESIVQLELADAGEYFVRITGDDDTVQFYELEITATTTDVTVLPGDYNGDQVVDAKDYTLWRDTLGSTTSLAADGNGNNLIDAGDHTVWKNNFGNVSATSALVGVNQVPEPGTLAILSVALVVLLIHKRPPLAD